MIISILVLLIIACNSNKRKEVENIIKDFEVEKVQDKREVVFNIDAVCKQGKLVLKGETSEAVLKNQLFDELKSIVFSDSVIVLPDASVGENKFGIVTVPVANMRATPSHSSELVTQAVLGTPVKILKNRDGWYYIQTPDKYISWVDAAEIFPADTFIFQEWKSSERIIFTGINGLIFKDTDLDSPISDVTLGSILQKKESNNRWIKVCFPDGRTGFTPPKDWIDFSAFVNQKYPNPDEIVLRAKQLTGCSYLWGGTSAKAMDCSGFVKTVYFINGLILARDASLQATHGKEITLNETQSGDLLFFGRQATENLEAKITHVALSLGGTEFIHASGFIKQNSFNSASKIYSEYRKNSFIKALRIINFEDEGIQLVKNHPWYWNSF